MRLPAFRRQNGFECGNTGRRPKKIMKALIPEKPKASAAFVCSAGSGFMTLFPIGNKTVQRYA